MARKKQTDKEGVSKITIYKLNDDFSAEKQLSEYKNQKNGTLQGWNYKIFTRLKPNMPPSWKPLVKDLIDDGEIPKNSYASLVFIFEKDGTCYALTSGYGYADIREFGVKDFGIDISCKSLDPNQLNHLYQKQPTGNVYGLSRSLRGKYIPTNDSVNQRSVLKALKGKIINQDLGVTMEGRTSLAVSGKKNLSDVVNLLDEIVKIEKSNKLTVNIKGLDEVDKKLREELDEELTKKINDGQFDDVLFGYDDDLIFRNCEKLKVGNDNTEYLIDETQKVFSAAQNQDAENPANVKVVGYDEQDQKIFTKKLFDLIEGELDFKNDKYFRIDKKWYKTNDDYKNKIDNDFKTIEKIESNYFKPWQKENGSFVDENTFLNANIDSNKIIAHTQKISQIEIADIIDKTNYYFVHVKKGRGAFLRNLFAQGYVSGSLFNGEDAFKNSAKKKFSIDIDKKYTVVFAIFPEDENKIDSIFTLFAKVDFLERCESLKSMGFDVKYCLINNS
jgi:uncharacterized protein (TIGR04141 family)